MDVFDLYATINIDSSDYERGLDDASSKTSSFGDKVKSFGEGLSNFGSVLTSSITMPVKDSIMSLAEYGDAIDKNSQKLGMSAEKYQEWDAILQHSGASINSLQPSLKNLSSKYDDAIVVIRETSAAAEDLEQQFESGTLTLDEYNEKYYELYDAAYEDIGAFGKLGISMSELENTGGDTEKIFALVIKKLQEMPEGAERTAIASDLLGRSATELGALFNTSAEDTEKMRQKVHELGGVMSDEAVKDAAAFQDSLQDLQTSFAGVARNVISEFLPVLSQIMDVVADVISRFSNLDEGTQQVIITILGVVAVVGPLLSGLGKVISVVSSVGSAISSLGSLFSLFTNPVGLVIAAIAGIVVAFITLWNKSESFRQFWIGLWEGIKNVISKVADFISGIFKGIGNIIGGFWDWITGKSKSSLDEVETDVKNTWDNVESSTSDSWNSTQSIIDGALTGMQSATSVGLAAIGNTVDTTWQDANSSTETNWSAIAATTSDMSNESYNAVAGNFSLLSSSVDSELTSANNANQVNWDAIASTTDSKSAESLDAVTDSFGQMEGAVVDGIVNAKAGANAQDWYSVGTNIVDGMSSGVYARASELAQSVASTAMTALSAAKSALGIASPSKKFRDIIGINIGAGIAVGVEQSQKSVLDSIYKMSDNVQDAFDSSVQPYNITGGVEIRNTGKYQTAYSGAGATAAGNVTNVTINSPKAVDAVQAAREWKKTTRQIALGFI